MKTARTCPVWLALLTVMAVALVAVPLREVSAAEGECEGDVCVLPAPPPRALWVWASNAGKRAVADATARKELLDFCAAPHGRPEARITTLYLEADEEEGLPGLIADAHGRGMKVEAIVGKADFSAEDLPWLKERVGQIMRYNEKAAPSGRYDGLHFDVEPGEEAKWSQQAYRELLGYARKKADDYKAASSHHMVVAADIGWHWRRTGDDDRPQYLDAMELCDYVVCMSYRDRAERQLEAAVDRGQVEEAHTRGLDFWVGCETGRLEGQDGVTYYEEGWEYMEGEIAKLPGLFTAKGLRPAGIAIHYYDSYVGMSKGPEQ